nr:FtsX-like permease family protein [Cellulomonas sp. JH27-2]
MGVLEAVLIVGPAFAVGARRVERLLALVAACGGDQGTMRSVVVLTGLITGLAASLVGAVVGLVGAVLVRGVLVARGSTAFPELRVPWLLCVAFVVVGAVVATAASWLPARRATRMDVVAALGGRRVEARPHPKVPLVGIGLVVGGLVAAVVGALQTTPALLVAGPVAIQVGVVVAAGGLVTLVGRLAPRAGVAARIAMRDAARQRGRTAPAIAAVIAAVAGIVAGAVYAQSSGAAEQAIYRPSGAVGTVMVAYSPTDPFGNPLPDSPQPDSTAVERALRGALPVGSSAILRTAVPADADGAFLVPAPRPALGCPAMEKVLVDPQQAGGRCYLYGDRMPSTVSFQAPGQTYLPTAIVDDGSAAEALEGGDVALGEAVAKGTVLVTRPDAIWPDGTVHLYAVAERDVVGLQPTAELVAPARLVAGLGQFEVLVNEADATALGMSAVEAGVVASTTRMPTDDEQKAAETALARQAVVGVEPGYHGSTPVVLLILVAGAVVVGLGATALAMALAAAEFRPDLATLGAIGAGPRTRRRVAAAQAGVVVVVGVGLGAVTGLLLGGVLVLALHQTGSRLVPVLHLVVPWPALAAIVVGVPVLAMGGAYVLTRSRLPMARRVVG